MAKSRKTIPPHKKNQKLEEPSPFYHTAKKALAVAEFTFKKFKKIADLVPFTQTEWANILHLSERTLQRYAKSNSSFEGIYTDRILQMEELIEQGLQTFTDAAALYGWLKRDKKVLGHTLNFDSLYSSRGIQETTDQLARIQYGVYT